MTNEKRYEINAVLEAITFSRFGDTVYLRVLEDGKLHVDGEFTVEDLELIVEAFRGK